MGPPPAGPFLRRQSRGRLNRLPPASSEDKAGRDLLARLQLRGQSAQGNSDLWGAAAAGPCVSPRVGGLAQARRPLCEGWWGDVADAPVSPPQRRWEWEPLPGSQRPRHAHGAPECGGPGAVPAGTVQQGLTGRGGPTWLTQLAWLRVLTALM